MHLLVERFVLRRTCNTHASPAASQNRRLNQLPIDPLIVVVGCGKRCKIPARLERNILTDLRIAGILQWWPACRGYVRWLRAHPVEIE